MEHSNANFAFASRFAHGLVAAGVRHVCISPGSRNTPLALTLGRHPGLTDWVIHDERSAAFFAIGLAKATGVPAVVLCTSGTAAAEYLPAIVEAGAGRVPMLVLTADRPPELRSVGAPQAVDQVAVYGRAVRWFHETGVPDAGSIAGAAALAVRACLEALRAPSGAVHLNVPMREPLAPISDGTSFPGDAPLHVPASVIGRTLIDPAQLDEIASSLSGRRVMVIAGAEATPGYPEAVVGLASALEAPIMGDVLSGLRAGEHDRRLVLSAPDLLAGAGMLDRYRPEAIIRLGALPTEKSVWTWLADHAEIPQILVDPGGWRDPMGSASTVVVADAVPTCHTLGTRVRSGPLDWAAGWIAADRVAASAATSATLETMNEPAVAASVVSSARPGSLVVAASSMPVRDLGFLPLATDRSFTVLANRGANGIDGTISMALGAAATAETTLLIGDVATLHDVGALRTAALLGLPLRILVVHNDGGGIFHFLRQADPSVVAAADFERYLATPHGTDFVAIGRAMGIASEEVTDLDHLRQWLAAPTPGPRLAQVRTDRSVNETIHRSVREAVAAALR